MCSSKWEAEYCPPHVSIFQLTSIFRIVMSQGWNIKRLLYSLTHFGKIPFFRIMFVFDFVFLQSLRAMQSISCFTRLQDLYGFRSAAYFCINTYSKSYATEPLSQKITFFFFCDLQHFFPPHLFIWNILNCGSQVLGFSCC